MIKMVVTRDKPVRYPSGPTGKEYKTGQEFEALSERDAKALSLVRAAKVVEDAPKAAPFAKPKLAVVQTQAMQAEQPAKADDDITPRRYRRRDMLPEA